MLLFINWSAGELPPYLRLIHSIEGICEVNKG